MEQIRKVNGAGSFAPNHAHKARMRVSEGVDGDTSQEIEILAPMRVVEPASAPTGEYDRRTFVCVHQMAGMLSANSPGGNGTSRRGFFFRHFLRDRKSG